MGLELVFCSEVGETQRQDVLVCVCVHVCVMPTHVCMCTSVYLCTHGYVCEASAHSAGLHGRHLR